MNKDWVGLLEKQRQAILQDSKKLHIINAGRMNHGKSSLFNSLLGKPVFAVEDIRTTREQQEAAFDRDVILIDTPGLDADQSDDTAAFKAYKRANLIVFVHSVKTGAVEGEEIRNIQRMEKESASPDYFWKHFILVLTSIDEYSAEEADQAQMQKIEKASLENIKKACGREGFPVFCVSNTRYSKGVEKQNSKLMELSGVQELKGFINSHLGTYRKEQSDLAQQRFAKAKEETLKAVQAERESEASQIAKEEEKWNDWVVRVRERAGGFSSIKDLIPSIERAASKASEQDYEIDRWQDKVEAKKEARDRALEKSEEYDYSDSIFRQLKSKSYWEKYKRLDGECEQARRQLERYQEKQKCYLDEMWSHIRAAETCLSDGLKEFDSIGAGELPHVKELQQLHNNISEQIAKNSRPSNSSLESAAALQRAIADDASQKAEAEKSALRTKVQQIDSVIAAIKGYDVNKPIK
ncbi:MAG: 50S ribosome-binding GTPase [bacterium]|nr:50S ribosome-binding GTPase [bacterium]